MRRTFALFAVAFASLAAAAVAALLGHRQPPPRPAPSAVSTSGPLRMSVQLDRRYLPGAAAASPYLQIDLTAVGARDRSRVPVDAVLILDRSGSMSGVKMDRARDAARALVQALGEDDRLSIVEFGSDAAVALPTTAVTPQARARALAAIEAIEPTGGTNLGAALAAAGPQLAEGRGRGRVEKVFLASDGQANEGISDRNGLLRLAASQLAGATLSTFGVGDDYDEDLMAALAAQAGGRARYIDSPQILPGAFRDELSRASTLTARNVRVRVLPAGATDAVRPVGYAAQEGWIRLPDFAAGEERRVLYRLELQPRAGTAAVASVELVYEGAEGKQEQARADASATFTADASLLGQPAGEAAVHGAQAEMAEGAAEDARVQETGRGAEAQEKIAELKRVAYQAARAAPARAAEMEKAADTYEEDVVTIDSKGGAASKKLKQKAFDAVRAPVAGW